MVSSSIFIVFLTLKCLPFRWETKADHTQVQQQHARQSLHSPLRLQLLGHKVFSLNMLSLDFKSNNLKT